MATDQVVLGLYFRKDSAHTDAALQTALQPILGTITYSAEPVAEMGGLCAIVLTEQPFSFTQYDNYGAQLAAAKALTASEQQSLTPICLYERTRDFKGVAFRKEKTDTLAAIRLKLQALPATIPPFASWDQLDDNLGGSWITGTTKVAFGPFDFEGIRAALTAHIDAVELATLSPLPS